MDRFFEALAATGHVLKASLEVGYESTSAAYKRQEKDAAFRARWSEALSVAEQRIEDGMRARALNAAQEGGIEGDLATAPVSFRDALAFLNRASKKRSGPTPLVPLDPEAARAALIDMVLAIKRGRQERDSQAA